MTEQEKIELLVRYADGDLSDRELALVSSLLRDDPPTRAAFRSLAEQAVEIADFERTAAERDAVLNRSLPVNRTPPSRSTDPRVIRLHSLKWAFPLAAMLVLLFGAVIVALNNQQTDSHVAVIRGMGTDIEWTGPDGQLIHDLRTGDSLAAGMDVRTLADDGWLWLEMRDGSEVIVTAHSKLTTYADASGQTKIRLQEGNLWGVSKGNTLPVTTTAAEFASNSGVFHIEACPSLAVLRVYEGNVAAVRSSDQQSTAVAANQQVTVAMNNPRRLIAVEQPAPVNFWNCSMLESPQSVVGTWVMPSGSEQVRLKATPHQLMRKDGSSLMIYLTKFNVASSGSPAVLLETDSVLRVRGRTRGEAKIRFGVTTQKLRGLYTGKYRTIIADELERDETGAWSIELPVAEMELLDDNQDFSRSPIGAELNSIMVYTVNDDIDLEIHRVELLPRTATD